MRLIHAPAIFLIMVGILGSSCNTYANSESTTNPPKQTQNSAIDTNTGSENKTAPPSLPGKKGITIDDVSSYLLLYQETAEMIAGEGANFIEESVDPTLQAQYMENGSDVPLMRYLGKKGLNNIESNNLEDRIISLQNSPANDYFGGSTDRLDKALIFLKRFYTNIETLQSFEEYKIDIADFSSHKDSLLSINDEIQMEYETLKGEYPNLNYKMSDSIVSLIVLELSPTPTTNTKTIKTTPDQANYSNTIQSDSNKRSCCKYCSTGKACGDSCISKSYTCHKAAGCACDSN